MVQNMSLQVINVANSFQGMVYYFYRGRRRALIEGYSVLQGPPGRP